MNTSISRVGERVRRFLTPSGVEITLRSEAMSEKERILAIVLGFTYSALGVGFGIYCLFKGVQLFQAGIVEGHGSWNGGGFQFQDLAPGTLLFLIGGYCFKSSAFIVKGDDTDNAAQTEPAS